MKSGMAPGQCVRAGRGFLEQAGTWTKPLCVIVTQVFSGGSGQASRAGPEMEVLLDNCAAPGEGWEIHFPVALIAGQNLGLLAVRL